MALHFDVISLPLSYQTCVNVGISSPVTIQCFGRQVVLSFLDIINSATLLAKC